MDRLACALASALLMIAATVWPAFAESRVALVIGNGAYRNATPLANPANDAGDVATSLERLGFSVTRVTDGTYDAMRRELLDFSKKVPGSEMAVVFFAGHGMEVGGENWLIPVDAELASDLTVDQEAVNLKTVMLMVGGASRLGLVMLDACRNNPYAAKMVRSVRTRAVDRGLARVEPTGSVLVAYAAKDGTTALDGSGRNSPFTTALLRHIETPGLEINFLFRNVRDEVISLTGREQEPFVYGSLSREEIFLREPLPSAAGAPSGPNAEDIAWTFVRESTDPNQIKRFISEFPDSSRRKEAEQRLTQVESRAKSSHAPATPIKTCFTFNGQQVCN
ncbi:MAG: caspase domain-containing protein [Pseudorhodoplanes sp.]